MSERGVNTLVQRLRDLAGTGSTALGGLLTEAADTIERLERELGELRHESQCATCKGSGQVNGGLGYMVPCSMCFGTGKARP